MLRIAALPYASLDLAMIGYNFALLFYTSLHLAIQRFAPLHMSLFGCNFAILVCTLPFCTQQNFAGLSSAGLYYTEQNYAAIGYNYA